MMMVMKMVHEPPQRAINTHIQHTAVHGAVSAPSNSLKGRSVAQKRWQIELCTQLVLFDDDRFCFQSQHGFKPAGNKEHLK
jgi:hypothetical protein